MRFPLNLWLVRQKSNTSLWHLSDSYWDLVCVTIGLVAQNAFFSGLSTLITNAQQPIISINSWRCSLHPLNWGSKDRPHHIFEVDYSFTRELHSTLSPPASLFEVLGTWRRNNLAKKRMPQTQTNDFYAFNLKQTNQKSISNISPSLLFCSCLHSFEHSFVGFFCWTFPTLLITDFQIFAQATSAKLRVLPDPSRASRFEATNPFQALKQSCQPIEPTQKAEDLIRTMLSSKRHSTVRPPAVNKLSEGLFKTAVFYWHAECMQPCNPIKNVGAVSFSSTSASSRGHFGNASFEASKASCGMLRKSVLSALRPVYDLCRSRGPPKLT